MNEGKGLQGLYSEEYQKRLERLAEVPDPISEALIPLFHRDNKFNLYHPNNNKRIELKKGEPKELYDLIYNVLKQSNIKQWAIKGAQSEVISKLVDPVEALFKNKRLYMWLGVSEKSFDETISKIITLTERAINKNEQFYKIKYSESHPKASKKRAKLLNSLYSLFEEHIDSPDAIYYCIALIFQGLGMEGGSLEKVVARIKNHYIRQYKK